MAFSFFRKKQDESTPSTPGEPAAEAFQRDPAKAQRFFDHAQTIADSRNYGYAMELYISGLRHDPSNMAKHEALRDVALKYKVGGGKPAGLGERMKTLGKDPVSRMLDAERIWSKDPLNVSLMLEVMERAKEADQSEDGLDLTEFVYWVGKFVLDFGRANKKTPVKDFIKARDLFRAIGAVDMAVQANRIAIALKPGDSQLVDLQRDLETELTLVQGAYSEAEGKEGGFRKMVRDLDKQTALQQQDAIVHTASSEDQLIDRMRTAWQEKTDDVDRLTKLVAALQAKGDDASENEAVDLLQKAYESTGEYRHRVRLGDIRLKQLNRHLRELRDKARQDPEAAKKYKELAARLAQTELEEFTERAEKYPTDLGVRYRLGRALMTLKKYDDAIGAFQESRADAKWRTQSHIYLGAAYVAKGWLDEAVDTFRQGIAAHPIEDDDQGLELRYGLMDALEKSAAKSRKLELAQEAQKIASKILQTNIKFRDIRNRLDGIRKLAEELAQPPTQ